MNTLDKAKTPTTAAAETKRHSIYDIAINGLDGKPIALKAFKGKKILFVNVASECGFTNQYKELQALSDSYADKTGTLTNGKPAVTAIKAYGISEKDLLLMAAEAEIISEHHLGRAIVREAERKKLTLKNKPTEVEILKGRGIEVNLDGKSLYIGNRKGLLQNKLNIDKEVEFYATEQEKAGNTAVYIADEEKIIGIISIADTIREKAKETIAQLKLEGIEHLVMLTGDNNHTARIVGEQLGMDGIYGELLPEDKAQKVKECMGKGIKLAMLGDGVNDAPAIASADVGIAMGVAGTDIAMETADVVLMADNLDKLIHALKLSKATVSNMKQNMFFAVGTVSLLLAGVLTKNINLASGMFIHELSVLLVILNAIRLVRYKPSAIIQAHQKKEKSRSSGKEVCLGS